MTNDQFWDLDFGIWDFHQHYTMLYRLKQLTLLFGDLVALFFGLLLAITERYWSGGTGSAQLLWPMTILFGAAIVTMFVSGLYDVGRLRNTWSFYQRVIVSAAVWFVVGVVFFYLRPNAGVSPKTILLLTTLNSFALVAIWRFLYNRFLSTEILKTNIVFVGMSPEIAEIIALINQEPQRGYHVIGAVTMEIMPAAISTTLSAPTLAQLLARAQLNPSIIVMAPRVNKNLELLKELYGHLFRQTTIYDLEKFYEEIFGRIPPFTFSESWFLYNLNEQQKKIYDRLRIVIDYCFAIIMGLFFGVTFPFIAGAIKLNSPGPIFFRQERVGRMGELFFIYKYRTMKALSADGSAETGGAQFASVGDDRITRVGKFLRATRLDEIPQFLNIFKNEMGIIGPRPERPEFVSQLVKQMPFYSLRHLIKPGLTGWAQIKQSYYGTLEENLRKLEYDLYYIKNRGFWMDVAIVLRTINIVLGMRGR